MLTTRKSFLDFFWPIIFSISSPVVTGTVDLVIIILNLEIDDLISLATLKISWCHLYGVSPILYRSNSFFLCQGLLGSLIIKSFFVRLISSKIIFKLIFPIIKFAYKNDITLIKKLLTNDPKPHKKESFPSEYKFRLSQTQINDIIFQFKNLKYLRKLREINYRAYSEGIKNEKIIFFHNKQNLLNENAYLNFPIIVKDKNKFISYMLDNEIDISPQFYRSVNELSFLSKYSKTTKLIQDSVSNLVTLPTYSEIINIIFVR